MTARELIESTYPHHEVYARIAPSKISGVGVFAIRNIPARTSVFLQDNDEISKVPATEVEKLEPELQRLYRDFCPRRGNIYLCPPSFNTLNPAYYVNHSKSPNLKMGDDLKFYANRSIKRGEELTVDYSTYSDLQDWANVQ